MHRDVSIIHPVQKLGAINQVLKKLQRQVLSYASKLSTQALSGKDWERVQDAKLPKKQQCQEYEPMLLCLSQTLVVI